MASKTTPQHSIFVTIMGELIGIAVMAVLADLNEGLGQVLAAIMIGWLIVWLMLNATEIQSVVAKVLGGKKWETLITFGE